MYGEKITEPVWWTTDPAAAHAAAKVGVVYGDAPWAVVDYETPFGMAWSALRSIATEAAVPVAVQLQAQRAMDNLRTLYPAATEGLES